MTDIHIRKDGQTGHITLTRPQALNAMTYDMCLAIEAAVDGWRADDAVRLVIIDAVGDRAFCAGGDIAELYDTGTRGDFAYGQRFWADEYRLNAKLAAYPKPIVSFLQGFVMGGGVGIGCHASHRITCESTQIAMPECGIGLVPDVGGSFLLARAPGRLGEYLGLTGARMSPGDAIFAGFADHFIPQDRWQTAKGALVTTGDVSALADLFTEPPAGTLAAQLSQINAVFGGEGLRDVLNLLGQDSSDFAQDTLKALHRNSPLAMACALEIQRRLKAGQPTMEKALDLEYRFTFRAMEHGDFLEGIRAQIIDKDRNPRWRHEITSVPLSDIARMLQPLRADGLKLDWGEMT